LFRKVVHDFHKLPSARQCAITTSTLRIVSKCSMTMRRTFESAALTR
jgi:hypothetical protein